MNHVKIPGIKYQVTSACYLLPTTYYGSLIGAKLQ